MRSDTSMDSLNVTRSESVTDLNTELNGLLHSRRASTGHTRNDENFVSAPAKPFGIGKQTFHFYPLHFSNETFPNNKFSDHTFYDFLIAHPTESV